VWRWYVIKEIRYIKKDDWRGNLQKENEIKAALYEVLQDKKEVERIFAIVKEQREY
jgi:type I restriction enzyme, R subunit